MRPRFTLVVSHLTPSLGLERSAIRLAQNFPGKVDVVCLAQDPDALPVLGLADVTTLGSPVRGLGRVRTVRRARRWLASASGTVVVAGVWPAIPLLLARRRRDAVRVIVWEHSLSGANVRAHLPMQALGGLARLLYRRADGLVCVSTPLAERMGRMLRGRAVATIPNFVDALPISEPSRAAPDRTARGLRLLSVGRLVPIKNPALLLDVLRTLNGDVELDVAGDGPLRQELELGAKRLGVADRVRFLGHVDDVDPLYESCDVVVLSSREETFGLVLFEAAARHRPVVVAAYDVARQFVPRFVPGVIAQPTPEAFAAAVRSLRASPPTPEEFVLADRARAEAFGDEATRAKWLHVIEAVER